MGSDNYETSAAAIDIIRLIQKCNEKLLRETQILRAGCSKAEPKFNQLEMVTTCTYRSMHAISSYRGNRHRLPQTHRQDRLQYTVPLASVQCNEANMYCNDKNNTYANTAVSVRPTGFIHQ